MNYHIITLDGEDIKFRLTSLHSIEIEKKTGVKLLDYIQDYSMTTIINLLMYMRRSEIANFCEKDAAALYDKLIDNAYTLEDVMFKIIYETAVVSGFLKKVDLEEVMANQEKLKSKKKQELLEK